MLASGLAGGSPPPRAARESILHRKRNSTPFPRAYVLLLSASAALALALFLPAPPAAVSPKEGMLATELDKLLANPPLSRARTSVLVLDAVSENVLFSRNPDLPLKPASNMKLVTSAAGLALLKPEYQFRTVFYADSPPDAAGVVHGTLYVKGGGSPGLVGEQWWVMARRLHALGLKRVEGDLVGDDTFFDAVRRGESWPSAEVDNPYNAPVSALSCLYNSVSITVRPTTAGKPPAVVLDPVDSFFKVVNRAVTAGHGIHLSVDRQWNGKQNIIDVGGHIGTYAEPYTTYKNVEQPTLYSLAAFREAASKEGIEITGTDRRGVVPPGTPVLYTHLSEPLTKLIQNMNKFSNNFIAETILKTIGAEMSGPPGTTEKGAEAVLSYLKGIGVETKGLVIADGSGLSHRDRMTARTLARILLETQKDFHAAPEFMASLPVGGVDGTLDRRLNDPQAIRNIRAKTGRINGVTSLSGYAWNKDGRLLIFSILVNDFGSREWEATHMVDRMGTAIVEADLPPEPNSQKDQSVEGG